MRLRHVTNLRGCLLLALLLPFQAFAALSNCASSASRPDSPGIHTSLPGASGPCEHERPSIPPHHDCGGCCSVAAADNPLQNWQAPRFAAPHLALNRIAPTPSVALDRLDRPPRVHSP